jgi:hypothetical protein
MAWYRNIKLNIWTFAKHITSFWISNFVFIFLTAKPTDCLSFHKKLTTVARFWCLNNLYIWCCIYIYVHKILRRTWHCICSIESTTRCTNPLVTTGLTYEQLGLRPKSPFWFTTKSWVTTHMPVKATWVTTRKAFVSFSLSPDTRVCGRNSGQCSALYN